MDTQTDETKERGGEEMGHFTCFSVLRSAPSILHCDNDVGGKKVKEEEVQSIEKKTGGCPYVLRIIVIGSLFFLVFGNGFSSPPASSFRAQ